MGALGYLLLMRVKNRLLAIVKRPASLIAMLCIIAFLVFLFATSGRQGDVPGRDIRELHAIVLLYLGFIFVQTAKGGIGRGVSLFKMPDANLLFTGPISSRQILFYGLMQQVGTSLMMGLVLLFQGGWIRNVYGASGGFIAALVAGYAITLFLGQLTAMVLYVFVAGNEKRRRAATWVLAGACLLAVGYVVFRMLGNLSNPLGAAVAAADGLPLSLFPVAGWMRAFIVGASGGAVLPVVLSLVASCAYLAAMVFWMGRMQPDYYEDVLQSTERSYSALLSAKEGRAQMPDNVRVGKTGIGGGMGASVFYFKHRLESRRAKRLPLDTVTLIMLAVSIGFAFFMRENGLLPALIFGAYMQFFGVAQGRWVRELTLPYVYRVPAPAFSKLLWCLMESFRALAIEAVLYAAGLFLVLGLTPVEALAAMLFRWSFAVLLTAGLLLVERLFTAMRLKWLVMMLVIVFDLLLIAPGVAAAIWVSVAAPGFLTPNLTMMLVPALVNLPMTALALFLSRDVLAVAELNNG